MNKGIIERNKEVTLLLREVGEISREYAAMAVRLEQVTDTMREMSARQEALISTTRDSVQIASQAVAPNPELIAVMQQIRRAIQTIQCNCGFTNECRTRITQRRN